MFLPGNRCKTTVDRDTASFGKLYRITDKIEQDIAQYIGRTIDGAVAQWLRLKVEGKALIVNGHRHDIANFCQQVCRAE